MTKKSQSEQAPLLDLKAEPQTAQETVQAAKPENPTKKKAGTTVSTQQPHAVATQSSQESMLQVIARAAGDPRTNVEKMRILLDMQKELMALQAKIEFDEQFAAMAPHLPVIDKKGRIVIREKGNEDKVRQSTPYAKYEDINEAIIPVISEYGFGVSYETSMTSDGRIKVITILARKGHERRSEFVLPHDSTGSKNAVQAIGSSNSYAKRYGLCDVLNLTTRGIDDDGKSGGGIPLEIKMSEDQIANLKELCATVDCEPERLVTFMDRAYGGKKGVPNIESLEAIPAKLFDAAMKQLLKFDKDTRAARAKEATAAQGGQR